MEKFSFQTLRPRIPEESKCIVICRIAWSEYSTGDNLQLAVFSLLLTGVATSPGFTRRLRVWHPLLRAPGLSLKSPGGRVVADRAAQ
ncbi:hypothetical protein FKM82_023253 [Ascaphus truei]